MEKEKDLLALAKETNKQAVELMHGNGYAIVGFDSLSEAEDYADKYNLKTATIYNDEPNFSKEWNIDSYKAKEHDSMLDEPDLSNCYVKGELYDLPSPEEFEMMSEDEEIKYRKNCEQINAAIADMNDNEYLIMHNGWTETKQRFVTFWNEDRWQYQIAVIR